MLHVRKIKLVGIIIAICMLFTETRLSFASHAITIYDSSIIWEDVAARSQLLTTIPHWHSEAMLSLFDAYLNPERYQLSRKKEAKQYNAQFIHAFWGPLDNPFNKYARPGKVFVFISEPIAQAPPNLPVTEIFYMAPIIQNDADKNYYVFDNQQSQPMILADWIANIRAIHGNQKIIRINVCNSYGSLPTDSCAESTYQNEAASTLNQLRVSITAPPSAHRDIKEDWKLNLDRSTRLRTTEGTDVIYEKSRSWDDVTSRNNLLNITTAWQNYKLIKEGFEKIRDLRYFNDESQDNFMRRISWLYPDDGCWTRAAAVIKDCFGRFNNIASTLPRPAKIFAFGNLCANTPNSPGGRVSWWYHTAPVVRDAETSQSYVLDPSVNPNKPLTVEQWMADISSQSAACAYTDSYVSVFNICNGYGVGPYDNCAEPQQVSYATETYAMLGQY